MMRVDVSADWLGLVTAQRLPYGALHMITLAALFVTLPLGAFYLANVDPLLQNSTSLFPMENLKLVTRKSCIFHLYYVKSTVRKERYCFSPNYQNFMTCLQKYSIENDISLSPYLLGEFLKGIKFFYLTIFAVHFRGRNVATMQNINCVPFPNCSLFRCCHWLCNT